MEVTTESVTIGRVLKPFGVKGEVRVESLTDVPGRFENLPSVTLVSPNGDLLKTEVTQARPSGRSYLMKFSAFSSPEEAATFRGALIQVPQDSDSPSSTEQFYHYQLIGLAVHDERNRTLGQVEEIFDLPQHPIFVTRHGEKEFLIPATRHVVKHVDIKHKLMTVTPIEEWDLSYAV